MGYLRSDPSFSLIDAGSALKEISELSDSDWTSLTDDCQRISVDTPELRIALMLQEGQPYPGETGIIPDRFIVYQTSNTEHCVMDTHLDTTAVFPTIWLDSSFDARNWYTTVLCPRVAAIPILANAAITSSKPYLVIADTGATDHCFWDRTDFTDYPPIERTRTAAGGTKFKIVGTGVVTKTYVFNGRQKTISLHALHTPEFGINLVSISKLDEKSVSVTIAKGLAVFSDPNGTPFMRAERIDGMYRLGFSSADVTAMAAKSRASPVSRETWHRRLVHIGKAGLDSLIDGDGVKGIDIVPDADHGICEDCLAGKQARRPFDGIHEPEKEVGDRVYMDLWGPAQITGVGGARWVFHAVDGASAAVWSFVLKTKESAGTFEAFKRVKAQIETQTGKRVKHVRVDGGGEFNNKTWSTYLGEEGIILEVTTPHSSAQNGVGERGIRTTISLARCLLADSGLPKSMWPKAVETATYVQWFHPKRRNDGMTPWERFFGIKPDVSHLRVFGSVAYAKIIPADAKLNSQTVKVVMVGYNGTAGYQMWHAERGQFFDARDVVFEEGSGHWSQASAAGGELEAAEPVSVPAGSATNSETAEPVPHVPVDSAHTDTDQTLPPDVLTAPPVTNAPGSTPFQPRRASLRH
ncbi:unnamed protein product [Mycena citricolor]|uniref:Integrase catalytic domain-containing protein n=1 Tax=Mycena citricolor TaxID=2018698 RepID=A0AAD2Q1U0_9AGAR|nr:unnamed protein product [Mycena citricolor]